MEARVRDLVNELVNRLVHTPLTQSSTSSSSPNQNPSTYATLDYALRILSSRMTPSITADEDAMANSIKRQLVNQGKSSDALTFFDLYTKFASKTGPGSVHNKWAVLYLLKVLSDDRKNNKTLIQSSSGGLLPALFNFESADKKSRVLSDGFAKNLENDRNEGGWKVLNGDSGASRRENSRNLKSGDVARRGWDGGDLYVLKDPENIRDLAYKEFVNLLKEENEVSEEVLVRDVLYACQGIDGKYVKFDDSVDGYVLLDSVRVPRATTTMVRKLCELGWLFRKVKGYISESMERFPSEDVGTVGQAFCAALQDELSEYYKLLAVLEAQSRNPIPLVSESASSGNYLSLRRLSVWFAEPMVKMRLMAVLVNSCKVLKGGAMAGAIHMHTQHGDPLVHDFMKRLLRQVCSPLFEMVRRWVLEGELEDIFAELFVLGQSVKMEIGMGLKSKKMRDVPSRILSRPKRDVLNSPAFFRE